jgi:hypothetical protein
MRTAQIVDSKPLPAKSGVVDSNNKIDSDSVVLIDPGRFGISRLDLIFSLFTKYGLKKSSEPNKFLTMTTSRHHGVFYNSFNSFNIQDVRP